MKRMFSLLLALVIALCAMSLTAFAEEEPVELSVLMRSGGSSMSGYQEDAVTKYIEETLNLKLYLDFTATDEKLAAMLASGSLPDVCWVYSSSSYVPMIESGAVINLIDYIAESENIQNYAGTAISITQQTGAFGNSAEGVYFIPTAIVKEAATPAWANVGFWFRWDYYEELGYPELTDMYAAFDMVKQMMEAHPTNEEGIEYVGFPMWIDSYGGLQEAANLFGTYLNGRSSRDIGFKGGAVEIDLDTDTAIEAYTNYDSSLWYGLELANYAYRLGILDPDSFTQSLDAVFEKDNVAAVVSSMWGMTNASKYLKNDLGLEDKGYTDANAPVPVGGTSPYMELSRPVGSAHGWCISSNCENVEAAMRLLDWIYSDNGCLTMINGVEGEEWYIDENGAARYTDVHREHASADNAVDVYGLGKWGGMAAGNGEGMTLTMPGVSNSIKVVDAEYASADYLPIQKEIMEYYGATNTYDLIDLQYPDMKAYTTPLLQGSLNTALTDEMAIVAENILSYMGSASIELVMCETEEDFNALREVVVEELQSMGLQDLVDYCMAAVETCYAKIETIQY